MGESSIWPATAVSRIRRVRGNDRALVVWKGMHVPTEEPIQNVGLALLAAFVRTAGPDRTTAYSSTQMRRVAWTPPGAGGLAQHGVVARVPFREGSVLFFGAGDYVVKPRLKRVRDAGTERNAFQHPTRPGGAIDATPGSILQSINSTWDGTRHVGRSNARVSLVSGVMMAVVTRRTPAGAAILFDYEWM
jgi:hypothetical protein